MRVRNRQRVMQVNPERPAASKWRAAPRPPGKTQASRGLGAASSTPLPIKPRLEPGASVTGPQSTSGLQPACSAPGPQPRLGTEVPHRCPLLLPLLTRGQDKLYSTVAQGTWPGRCPQPSHLSPGASRLAHGTCPLPEAPPAPAWHGHRSSAPHHSCPQPPQDRGPHPSYMENIGCPSKS